MCVACHSLSMKNTLRLYFTKYVFVFAALLRFRCSALCIHTVLKIHVPVFFHCARSCHSASFVYNSPQTITARCWHGGSTVTRVCGDALLITPGRPWGNYKMPGEAGTEGTKVGDEGRARLLTWSIKQKKQKKTTTNFLFRKGALGSLACFVMFLLFVRDTLYCDWRLTVGVTGPSLRRGAAQHSNPF